MEVMYPTADMPLFQVSMLKSYDPAEHLRLGEALKPLREEGVLIIESGLSYHNLRAFGPAAKEPSAAFDRWLFDTLNQSHKNQMRRDAYFVSRQIADGVPFHYDNLRKYYLFSCVS